MSLYTYIDLYENGEKSKNIGFVKSEQRNGSWKLKVTIKNLPKTDTLMCEMKSLNKEEYIDRFQIEKGEGYFSREYDQQELWKRRISCGEVQGLLFQLSSHRYGKCIWKKNAEIPQGNDNSEDSEEKINPLELNGSLQVMRTAENHEEKDCKTEDRGLVCNGTERRKTEKYKGRSSKNENYGEESNETGTHGNGSSETWDNRNGSNGTANNAGGCECSREAHECAEGQVIYLPEEKIALPDYQLNHIEDNKWRQLGRMYTTVHPFHEEERGEYISIKPKDFVILCEKYQSLVNNSFLLHGYFNYRHIILGKVSEDRRTKYYLGVPGTYHEREKMVAVMFGFERFIGVDSEETGSFGYYMREVQI
ncbi:MAG: DUF6128 domain-containing protein [Lachnospiraceae bacterium]|nr:DUF6128 domain-containing protein [Lachnospiraceae bacterium]